MSKMLLSPEQTRAVLNGLPDSPEALGREDVEHLIRAVMTDPHPSERVIFDWLIYQSWMAPATEFPRSKDGRFHFYRRTREGREALSGGLMTRKPQWV